MSKNPYEFTTKEEDTDQEEWSEEELTYTGFIEANNAPSLHDNLRLETRPENSLLSDTPDCKWRDEKAQGMTNFLTEMKKSDPLLFEHLVDATERDADPAERWWQMKDGGLGAAQMDHYRDYAEEEHLLVHEMTGIKHKEPVNRGPKTFAERLDAALEYSVYDAGRERADHVMNELATLMTSGLADTIDALNDRDTELTPYRDLEESRLYRGWTPIRQELGPDGSLTRLGRELDARMEGISERLETYRGRDHDSLEDKLSDLRDLEADVVYALEHGADHNDVMGALETRYPQIALELLEAREHPDTGHMVSWFSRQDDTAEGATEALFESFQEATKDATHDHTTYAAKDLALAILAGYQAPMAQVSSGAVEAQEIYHPDGVFDPGSYNRMVEITAQSIYKEEYKMGLFGHTEDFLALALEGGLHDDYQTIMAEARANAWKAGDAGLTAMPDFGAEDRDRRDWKSSELEKREKDGYEGFSHFSTKGMDNDDLEYYSDNPDLIYSNTSAMLEWARSERLLNTFVIDAVKHNPDQVGDEFPNWWELTHGERAMDQFRELAAGHLEGDQIRLAWEMAQRATQNMEDDALRTRERRTITDDLVTHLNIN